MKRLLVFGLLLFLGFPATAVPPKSKKKPPCKPSLAECPDEGCGGDFDPLLNHAKNIRTDDQAPTLRSLRWIKKLDNPEETVRKGSREELAALGEGQKITVTAYLVEAKPGNPESCNCGLGKPAEMDNHLVLVSKTTASKFPAAAGKFINKDVVRARERESVTAEFTPRVRLDHPNFTRDKIRPLIAATPQKALLVRVTGMLMFDTEHFFGIHLSRLTDWEIHPVLKLEYCTTGDNCKPGKDDGWKSLDDPS